MKQENWNLYERLREVTVYSSASQFVWFEQFRGWFNIHMPTLPEEISEKVRREPKPWHWGTVVSAEKFPSGKIEKYGSEEVEGEIREKQVLIHPDGDFDTYVDIWIPRNYVVGRLEIDYALCDAALSGKVSAVSDGVIFIIQTIRDGERETLLQTLVKANQWQQYKKDLSNRIGGYTLRLVANKNVNPDWDHLELVMNMTLVPLWKSWAAVFNFIRSLPSYPGFWSGLYLGVVSGIIVWLLLEILPRIFSLAP